MHGLFVECKKKKKVAFLQKRLEGKLLLLLEKQDPEDPSPSLSS